MVFSWYHNIALPKTYFLTISVDIQRKCDENRETLGTDIVAENKVCSFKLYDKVRHMMCSHLEMEANRKSQKSVSLKDSQSLLYGAQSVLIAIL